MKNQILAYSLTIGILFATGCGGGGGGGGGGTPTSRPPIDGVYEVTTVLQVDGCESAVAGQSEVQELMFQVSTAPETGVDQLEVFDSSGVVLAVGDYDSRTGVATFSDEITYDGELRFLGNEAGSDLRLTGTITFSNATGGTSPAGTAASTPAPMSFSGTITQTALDGTCFRRSSVNGFQLDNSVPAPLPWFVETTVELDTPIIGMTAGARDHFSSSCGGDAEADLAFLFHAEEAGDYSFRVVPSDSTTDVALSIRSGDPDVLSTVLACADAPGSAPTELVLSLDAGQRVVVVIDTRVISAPSPLTEEFELTVSFYDPIPLPACAAGVVELGPAAATGSNASESDDFQPSCSAPGGRDIAFLFIAPTAGTFSFDTFGSGYDTTLLLLETDCSTVIACNDDSSGSLQSHVTIDLAAGEPVIVVIDAFSSSSSGNYVLNIDTVFTVLYRVNCGGPSLPARDGAIDWSADSWDQPSPYVNESYSYVTEFLPEATPDATVPGTTPDAIFHSERYDSPGGAEMLWTFPAAPGLYEVRLYFAENFATSVGQRQFDVVINGSLRLDNFDVVAEAGIETGTRRSFPLTVAAGVTTIDIEFLHVIENPMISGIEIIRL